MITYASRFTFHIYVTLVLFAAACLGTRYAAATETQQLYDKAALYKQMYQTALEVGRDYYFSKREGEAVSRYFPLYLGTLYYEMGEWEKAIQSFKRFERPPGLQTEDKALSRIRRGMALYRRGRKTEAKKIWWAELNKSKKYPKIRNAIGYAYARSDFRLDEALRLCQVAPDEASGGSPEPLEGLRSLNPDDHFIRRNLGWAYFKNGDIQKARELLESIDFETPDFLDKQADRRYEFYDAAILLHLSHLYFKMVAQSTAPEDRLLAATARYELGEYKTAMEGFQRLAEKNSRMEGMIATLRLGACHYQLNQRRQAHRIWAEIRRKMPDNKEMLSELGGLYSSLKVDAREAEIFCLKALPTSSEMQGRVTQENHKYYRNLGRVYLNNGKYEDAKNALSQTRNPEAFNSVHENGSLFFLRLANCYYHLKNFNEALSIYGALAEDDKAGIQIYEMVKLISIVKRKQKSGVGVSRAQ